MYPLLLAYAVLALPVARALIPRPVVLGVLAVAAIALLANNVERVKRGMHCVGLYRHGIVRPCVEDDWEDFITLSMRMRERLPDGSVVLSRKPTILYAESGYRSLVYPFSPVRDTLFVEARRVGARYVIADASILANQYLYPALSAYPSRFCIMPDFQRIRASLMRIEPESSWVRAGADTGAIKTCAPGGER